MSHIGSFENLDFLVFAQTMVKLTVTNVNRNDFRGTSLKYAISKTPCRRSDVDYSFSGGIDSKFGQCCIEFVSSSRHKSGFTFDKYDGVSISNQVRRLAGYCPFHQYSSCVNKFVCHTRCRCKAAPHHFNIQSTSRHYGRLGRFTVSTCTQPEGTSRHSRFGMTLMRCLLLPQDRFNQTPKIICDEGRCRITLCRFLNGSNAREHESKIKTKFSC